MNSEDKPSSRHDDPGGEQPAPPTHFYPLSKGVHEFIGRDRPEFLERYNAVAGVALLHTETSDEVGLPARYRELVVLGILAFRGIPEQLIAGHIKRALDLGATRAEILDAFECTLVPGGAPTMLNGFRALMSLERADADAGADASGS
jgi:alkylhydroperoxidase/carboxymuconolactone decarboxylase family protein YurZ